MLRYALSITALLIACTFPASAQTIKQAATLGSFLETHSTSLGQASSNFTSMLSGLKGDEKFSAEGIYETTNSAQHYIDMLYVVVSIYAQMIDAHDQAIAKKYVTGISPHTIKASEASLKIINRELARLNSPAAISEAQKIRDLIIKIRDEIQRVVPAK
jgi:hypothetical protein